MFHTHTGTSLDGSNIRRALNAARRLAKISNFHFHNLAIRLHNTHCTGGMDLHRVQRLLGHKAPVVTQRYAHHYPESLREGVETLEAGRSVAQN